MNKSVIALLLLTTSAAFANEAADEQANRAAFGGERTRAEVNAELQRAQQQGAVGADAEYADYLQQASFTSTRSPAEVRAEAVQAARTRVIHELM